MQPRVTAVLVARNGAQYLPRTLDALAAQSRRPDSVLFVDSSSTDGSSSLLIDANPTELVTTPTKRSFGAAVAYGLQVTTSAEQANDWLWLLGHDNAPDPRALAALLGAVEVAPSVAVAGPKLMRWDEPDVISSYGETVTRFGRSVTVVENELDQAQHDVQNDLLAVAAGGMLVRRAVWNALGGFDSSLPSVDAALDFSVRARLAGHRVIGVPTAKVASAGPPELFGRRSLSVGAHNRARRFAQLHRRLAWAPAAAAPLHWLTLVPLAILRSLVHLVAKRPGAIGGEFAAAFSAAFDGGVPSARATIRRNRVLGWAAVDALRMPWPEVRERLASERAASGETRGEVIDRPGFFTGGGAWVVLLAALAGVVAFGRFLDAPALAGGGLVPLGNTFATLWSSVGYGWRDVGSGFVGAADPFAYLVAVLGSVTFWAPSFSIVLLYLLALPLAALSAWWCAARFSVRPWAPAIAAIAWAIAPPFLSSLSGGHLGAAIAHILLPSLLLALVGAARSWSLAAVAALLFAAVTAAAPVLAPAIVVIWFAWLVANPKRVHRLIGIPIPAAALFAPLVVEQLSRGNWLALLAEPGVPLLTTSPSGWQLALAAPSGDFHGFAGFLATIGLSANLAPVFVAALLAPLALLALLALFLPGSRRAIPAMVIALLGFVTAVAGAHIEVTIIGSQTTPIWPGAGLSLYWLGLVAALVVAIEAIGVRAAAPAFVAGLAVVALSVPLITAAATGGIAVTESNGRLLPAFASAEASTQPTIGTLELVAQPDGGISTTVHRGQGTTLEEQSTLDATATALSDADERLAELAGNISSRSGFDIAGELDELQIGFVLVPTAASESAAEVHTRIVESLDGNRILSPIGNTSLGYLWHYEGLADGDAPIGPGSMGTTTGILIIVGQAVIFGLTLLLAIPTSRRRRVRAAKVTGSEASMTELADPADDLTPSTADREETV